jgi:hypothetical protein
MRGASEQMEQAARDLRRADPSAAAQNADKAAEQLRRLEQQMRAGQAGAPQRAAGELQMEAQQIAQEQRRIAAEAGRLGQGRGSGNDEARRRLAEEKERLAGRVDELERAARQQAQRDPRGGTGAGEAATELERQRIGDRMRESASQMRTSPGDAGSAGSSTKPVPDAEQQIARALDRVVEKLGGGASADGRAMSEQLEQTGQMRERLNRIEQQMREAEATQAAQAGRQGGAASEARGGSSGQAKDGELQKLQQEYQRELSRARDALAQLGNAEQSKGGAGTTPERHEFSQSAPGTEAFKQDKSAWDSLRKDVDSAIERYEASLSQRLARKLSEDRLSAGGSERAPESYRQRIARYYESLATVKK